MPSGSSLAVVQKLYCQYYGRPADPSGQTYWAGQLDANGQNVGAILPAFANSAESQALYGNGNVSQLITVAYQNMFNRTPAQSEINYWAGLINNGTYSFVNAVNAIANACTGTDFTVLSDKYAGANLFTSYIPNYGNDGGAWYAGPTAIANGRSFLASIGATPDSGATVNEAVSMCYYLTTGQ